MNPERLVAGLDIGSSRTTAIIAEAVGDFPNAASLKILGVGNARTAGMRRGVVSDIEETTQSIQKAMREAERMAGVQVDGVYAGIAGEHVEAMSSSGVVAVNGDEVTRSDIERANEVARTQPIPTDRELLHAIPQEYRVDRNAGIRDPVGHERHAARDRDVSRDDRLVAGAQPAESRSSGRGTRCASSCSSRSRARSRSSPTRRRSSASRSSRWARAPPTSRSSTRKRFAFSARSRYGGAHVTSDIVHGIGVTQADAERLKEKYGCAYEPFFEHSDEVITLPSTVAQGDREIKRELLAHIIHQRMDEIFGLVNQQIRESGFAGRLSAGVVLTGGASAIMGAAELASDVFGTGARVGSPAARVGGLSDAVEAPRFSTAVGLALFGAHRMSLGGAGSVASGKRKAMSSPGVDKHRATCQDMAAGFFLDRR